MALGHFIVNMAKDDDNLNNYIYGFQMLKTYNQGCCFMVI